MLRPPSEAIESMLCCDVSIVVDGNGGPHSRRCAVDGPLKTAACAPAVAIAATFVFVGRGIATALEMGGGASKSSVWRRKGGDEFERALALNKELALTNEEKS